MDEALLEVVAIWKCVVEDAFDIILKNQEYLRNGGQEIAIFCTDIVEQVVYYVAEERGRDMYHLLPVEFRQIESCAAIPDILETAIKESIQIIAEMLGCENYKTSYFEFWFLDVLTDGLIKAQQGKMSQDNQKILMKWFCYFMKRFEMKEDHQTFINILKEYILRSLRYISENEGNMATPEIIDEIYGESLTQKAVSTKVSDTSEEKEKEVSRSKEVQKMELGTIPKIATLLPGVNKDEKILEINLTAIINISTFLHDVFSDELIFMLIGSFFKKRPLYLDVYSPYGINIPKRIVVYQEMKPPESEKSARRKGKKSAESIEATKEEFDLTDVILPLQMAINVDFFEELWPPTFRSVSIAGGKKKK